MLPQKNRLEREKFTEILKVGRRMRAESLTLVFKQNSEIKMPKIGIVVGKKVAKKAVDRNKIKRRIRDILIQEILPSSKAQIEGVLMVYPGINEKKFEEVKKEVLDVFSKIG